MNTLTAGQTGAFRDESEGQLYQGRVIFLNRTLILVRMTIEDMTEGVPIEDATQMNTTRLIAKAHKDEQFTFRVDLEVPCYVGEFLSPEARLLHQGLLPVPAISPTQLGTPLGRWQMMKVTSTAGSLAGNNLYSLKALFEQDYGQDISTMKLLADGRIVGFLYSGGSSPR